MTIKTIAKRAVPVADMWYATPDQAHCAKESGPDRPGRHYLCDADVYSTSSMNRSILALRIPSR